MEPDSDFGGTVVISGSSGLIGSALLLALTVAGMRPVRLVRRSPLSPDEVYWNPTAPQAVDDEDFARLEGAAAAIHLSGANLAAGRWTAAYKESIASSRLGSARALVETLRRLKQPPRCLLSASAVGVYGSRGDDVLDDTAELGAGFLADLCRAWEAEAARAAEFGARAVQLRFGVVLARGGGALAQMLPAFRAGVGGRLGSGRQWMSWIALSDLTNAVLHVLNTESLAGPVNVVAPIPVTNREFTHALGRALHRPAVLPVPAFVLRAALGDMADEALLASARAIPARLAASGFHFEQPEIGGALRSML